MKLQEADGMLWRRQVAVQAERHGPLLYRLAYGVVRDAASAEDACQQAMLKACERPEMMESGGEIRAWLARVVINESLQVVRRRRMERRVHRQAQEGLLGNHVAEAAGSADRGQTNGHWRPGEEAELHEAVVTALDKLPERARLVVALRIMEGISGQEVSELLGCSAAEVSRQLHQGMERLRVLLAEWKEDRE